MHFSERETHMRLTLTNELVQEFVGGQMEIQNAGEGYHYRGEIETIAVEEGELRVRFKWCAKGEGGPPLPDKWVNEENLDYGVSLEICAVSNIGPSGGDVGGGDRFSLNVPITGELVVLYPPDGSKLDPAKVEGLQVAQS